MKTRDRTTVEIPQDVCIGSTGKSQTANQPLIQKRIDTRITPEYQRAKHRPIILQDVAVCTAVKCQAAQGA